MEWVDQFPSGIITVGDSGDATVPKKVRKQTVNQTAMARGLALIKTGSTHKLPPMDFVVQPQGITTEEGFAVREHYSDWRFLLGILLVLIAVKWLKGTT